MICSEQIELPSSKQATVKLLLFFGENIGDNIFDNLFDDCFQVVFQLSGFDCMSNYRVCRLDTFPFSSILLLDI